MVVSATITGPALLRELSPKYDTDSGREASW
jgi:hypothetical protein